MYLAIEKISKRFGRKSVLSDINITAEKGSIVGVLGMNGSGKSTFFNVLAGVAKCDTGTFVIDGKNLFKNKALRSKTIGYVTQTPPLIDELTALDNLKLWYDKNTLDHELCEGVLKMLGVDEFLKVRVSKMSGGMKKRLAIGCAVAHKPSVLLLDEPTAALDLVCKRDISSYLNDFKNNGGTVIVATHDVLDLPMCDKIYIFKNGVSYEYDYDGNNEALLGKL